MASIEQMCQDIKHLEKTCHKFMVYFSGDQLFSKQKKSVRFFKILETTRQLVWGDLEKDRMCYLRDIREIRRGAYSKEFDRHQDEVKREDPKRKKCLVILYGNEFKLNSLSLMALDKTDADQWIMTLEYLRLDTLNSTYPTLITHWLQREFNLIQCSMNTIHLKTIISFVQKVLKLNIDRDEIKTICNKIDKEEEWFFPSFVDLYNDLIYNNDIIKGYFSQYFTRDKYFRTDITLKDFQRFIQNEQKDKYESTFESVRKVVSIFQKQSNHRCGLKNSEFMDYIFSPSNTIFDEEKLKEPMDMDQPLSCYWIASSHNSYLTGDQMSSDSSTECYARILLMGCRCLELDCWDGTKDKPIITHGRTFTSKIFFLDVLKTIKKYAFITSEFPLILSIEDHCSVSQQRVMASNFKEIFGDLLLTCPVQSKNPDRLPSPNQLKRKIIIKHKKLGEEYLYKDNDDVSENIKNGMVYVKDNINKEWYPNMFMLQPAALDFNEMVTKTLDMSQMSQQDDDIEDPEPWYHKNISREETCELMNIYASVDGTFLIRNSSKFQGELALSFWKETEKGDNINHTLIRVKKDHITNKDKFELQDKFFDTLGQLVSYYQENGVNPKNWKSNQLLKNTVPKVESHINKDWYYKNLNRDEAERKIAKVRYDGAFLVRRKKDDRKSNNRFVVSIRVNNVTYHCMVKIDGKQLFLARNSFPCLVALVEHFKKHALYRNVKLRYAVTDKLIETCENGVDLNQLYFDQKLTHQNSLANQDKNMIAIEDYVAQNPQEMTFYKGQTISNIKNLDAQWVIGDLGEQYEKCVPRKYVSDIKGDTTEGEDIVHTVNLLGYIVDRIDDCPGHQHIFRLTSQDRKTMEVSTDTQEDLLDWIQKIRECTTTAQTRAIKANATERQFKIASTLSDLVVYTIPCDYNSKKAPTCCKKMSSINEKKFTTMKYDSILKLKYHNSIRLCRVYPNGKRIDSSNYNPVDMWNTQCQLVALNYQTACREMQINQALFQQNGGTGYVLQPECIRNPTYDPTNRPSNVEPVSLKITLIGGRHLESSYGNVPNSTIEIEICSPEYDQCPKFKSKQVGNRLNPIWNEIVEFDVANSEMAMVRFVVWESDDVLTKYPSAQATVPLSYMRQGYRSVPLCYLSTERMCLASLLVHIEMKNPLKHGDSEMYGEIQNLRDQTVNLRHRLANSSSSFETNEQLRNEINRVEDKIVTQKNERIKRQRVASKLVNPELNDSQDNA